MPRESPPTILGKALFSKLRSKLRLRLIRVICVCPFPKKKAGAIIVSRSVRLTPMMIHCASPSLSTSPPPHPPLFFFFLYSNLINKSDSTISLNRSGFERDSTFTGSSWNQSGTNHEMHPLRVYRNFGKPNTRYNASSAES